MSTLPVNQALATVRALEDDCLQHDRLRAPPGVARLRLDPDHKPTIVDGLVTGMHAPIQSPFALLGAFADRRVLLDAYIHAADHGRLEHEFGDIALMLPGALNAFRAA